MKRCVQCGKHVGTVFKEFSHGNIRLTRCDRCDDVADKYVEYESVIIVLDLILHKPAVYRHLLFNRFDAKDPSFFKVSAVYVVLDFYVKWVSLKSQLLESRLHPDTTRSPLMPSELDHASLLLMALLEYLVYLAVTLLAVGCYRKLRNVAVEYSRLLMGMVVSSFGKFFLVLMMIYDYPVSSCTVISFFRRHLKYSCLKSGFARPSSALCRPYFLFCRSQTSVFMVGFRRATLAGVFDLIFFCGVKTQFCFQKKKKKKKKKTLR
eukprot:gnl/Hemi2/11936_TR4073_c0_g6_i1.p1 gnl/Hemi2/11936_TR4073_c0_g6~~gnl/Hemi2/11936_TR4073_c0_g6_i1.p1  ORF type:complete len:264 (-),score=52.31 gnl/Hemi2/11936_TR4073_c0_g6_i1:5-796(-)